MRKILLSITLVMFVMLFCGCCQLCSLAGSSASTYVIKSGSYADEAVSLNANSVLTYQVATTGGNANIYIANETSFMNFKNNPPNIHYLKHDVASPSCTGQFVAPETGTYYFMISNHGTSQISVAVVLKH